MIKKTERTKLKRLLKRSFIPDVQQVLRDNNILNLKGNEYSTQYISHVFNGRETNIDIENAIFEVYQTKKQELAKMQVQRRNIIEKNPEGGSSGF